MKKLSFWESLGKRMMEDDKLIFLGRYRVRKIEDVQVLQINEDDY